MRRACCAARSSNKIERWTSSLAIDSCLETLRAEVPGPTSMVSAKCHAAAARQCRAFWILITFDMGRTVDLLRVTAKHSTAESIHRVSDALD